MYEDNVDATSAPYAWPASLAHPPEPQRTRASALVVASFVLVLSSSRCGSWSAWHLTRRTETRVAGR
jgi:hypothetical protein